MEKYIKLTEAQRRQMLSLYEEGKMDSEIAAILGNVGRSAVWYWRKKLGLKSKFSYDKISKIDANKCKQLFEQGLSDYKIAKELGMSPDGVFSHRMRHGLIRTNSLKENINIPLTSEQKEFLLGTLLGDSSLSIGKFCKNPGFSCMHCVEQKEYAEYKTALFSSLGARCIYRKRNSPDKRNGKYYDSYTIETPNNPAFHEFYGAFYNNGKKHIPFDLLKYFTARSLALWYMDDGYKVRNLGYALSTHCFDRDELQRMQVFLRDQFGLCSSLWADNVLYIHKNSKARFESLISPYMCDCMRYKLIA